MTTLSGMSLPRLQRLFAADGRCFDVAVDHGFFDEGSFLAGIEDMGRAVATLVDAAPDAIQLSPGQARLLQDRAGPDKPALVLRTDVANVYHPELPRTLSQRGRRGRRRDRAAARRGLRRRQPAAAARPARAAARLRAQRDRRCAPRATRSACR